MNESVITDFQLTGECEINIQEVISQWDEGCFISQWHEAYTLCSKDSIKVSISKKDAHHLIGELDLIRVQSDVFKNGSTWKKQINNL